MKDDFGDDYTELTDAAQLSKVEPEPGYTAITSTALRFREEVASLFVPSKLASHADQVSTCSCLILRNLSCLCRFMAEAVALSRRKQCAGFDCSTAVVCCVFDCSSIHCMTDVGSFEPCYMTCRSLLRSTRCVGEVFSKGKITSHASYFVYIPHKRADRVHGTFKGKQCMVASVSNPAPSQLFLRPRLSSSCG